MGMAGLVNLLRWQWRAYWRRILRGGTAARSNLVVVGLISVAGLARYITFLRDVASRTAKGKTDLLELLMAGLLLVCIQPGWDAANFALGSRDMIRFPLQPATRLSFRILSRFVAPVSWLLTAACLAGLWPVWQLPHPLPATLTLLLLMSAAFDFGIALVDFAGTARGAKIMRIFWMALVLAAAGAWFAGVRTLPPLPSRLVVLAGAGNRFIVGIGLVCAALGFLAAVRALPWMLGHAPKEDRSGHHRSATRITLLSRELRLHSRFTEVRTAWAICAALCLYLATADRPEPDALRVMLGVLAFLTLAAAMNNFGADGVQGLDRFLLWPVGSARILGSKNAAFALTIAGPAVPLALLALWRFGWREGASDLLEAIAIVLAVLAWGNIASVRHPESAENASGGNIVDQIVAMVVIALPTASAIGVLRATGNWAPAYLLAIAAGAAALYLVSLSWSSRYIARNHERMRQGLT